MKPLKTDIFTKDGIDDYNVLNFLLQHVKGISPSSLSTEYIAAEESELE